MKPKRIQRKRTKGWKMPANTVYVGRPTIWGNPFRVTDGVGPFNWQRYKAVAQFSEYLPGLLKAQPSGLIESLRGKDLACWCSLQSPCHADVLLEIANADPAQRLTA